HLVALRSFRQAIISPQAFYRSLCPPGKEYQPCVSTCNSRTCLNKDYYEETTCSFIREECVCRSGTILHRADSPYCVTEDRCGECGFKSVAL
uniref:TIL domain-containing protein n=1 Tax=Fundulus heteroclitus TaxID=8078 RepID=A0A3Q2NV89_FUNHE